MDNGAEQSRAELLELTELAIKDLNALIMDLESSANWQTFDIFGGGLSSRMFKNKRVVAAARKIDLARMSVQDLGLAIRKANALGALPEGVRAGEWAFTDGFLDLPAEEWVRTENLEPADIQARAAVNRAKALRDILRQ